MRQPDASPCKLSLDNRERLFEVLRIKTLVCAKRVGVLSGLIVGVHRPFDDGPARQIRLILRRQVLIDLCDGVCDIRRVLLKQAIVPDLVEIPGLPGEGIQRLTKKFDGDVVPAAVMILARM